VLEDCTLDPVEVVSCQHFVCPSVHNRPIPARGGKGPERVGSGNSGRFCIAPACLHQRGALGCRCPTTVRRTATERHIARTSRATGVWSRSTGSASDSLHRNCCSREDRHRWHRSTVGSYVRPAPPGTVAGVARRFAAANQWPRQSHAPVAACHMTNRQETADESPAPRVRSGHLPALSDRGVKLRPRTR
jgi:hypothetical protein